MQRTYLTAAVLVAGLVGWVALEVGLGASFRTDGDLTPGSMRAGLLYSAVGLLGFAAVAFGLFDATLSSTYGDAGLALPAFVLAAISVAAAPGAVRGVVCETLTR